MTKGIERFTNPKTNNESLQSKHHNELNKKIILTDLYKNLDEVFDSPGVYPFAQKKILHLFEQSEINLVSRKQIISLFDGQVQPDATAGKVLNRLKKRIEKFGFSIQGEYYYRLTHLTRNRKESITED
jgi:hypothetical protein